MSYWFKCLLVYSITVFIANGSIGLASELPKDIEINGIELHKVGSGTRKKLFFVKIYDIGLYLPNHISDRKQINNEMAQSFVVVIRYKGSKSVGIPKAWRQELIPTLTKKQTIHLKAALDKAKPGDLFKINYVPSYGTVISIEDKVLLEENSYDVMSAFMNVWLGLKPISRRLANSLLSY